nr:MAG TPA: hypothetical protein [Caudoviricetes sp.]
MVSLLLDVYKLSPEIVFSDDLSLEEIFIMGLNKQAYDGYVNTMMNR